MMRRQLTDNGIDEAKPAATASMLRNQPNTYQEAPS
jgi:hypothetical protein